MEDMLNILIVEDNPVDKLLLEKILMKEGYKVIAVNNGQEAMEVLKKTFFPIVITDWLMAEMDGLDLCRNIRKAQFSSYIFIILLTSKTQGNDIVKGLDMGADDYLTKPVDPPELLARIRAGTRILELEERLSKALAEIRDMALTDALTKCYNRRYLSTYLSNEINRCERYKYALSLVMIDIDHFKKINDHYGHQIGDMVLHKIASTIKSTIRNGIDLLARYGGDEFVIALPETDLKGAYIVSERIRKKVAETVISIEPKNLKSMKITLSLGGVTYEPKIYKEKINVDILIKAADINLFKAKEDGKNKTITCAL